MAWPTCNIRATRPGEATAPTREGRVDAHVHIPGENRRACLHPGQRNFEEGGGKGGASEERGAAIHGEDGEELGFLNEECRYQIQFPAIYPTTISHFSSFPPISQCSGIWARISQFPFPSKTEIRKWDMQVGYVSHIPLNSEMGYVNSISQ